MDVVLLDLDAAMIPDKLLYHVPATPRAMLEKAMCYASRRMRVEINEDEDGNAKAHFFLHVELGMHHVEEDRSPPHHTLQLAAHGQKAKVAHIVGCFHR